MTNAWCDEYEEGEQENDEVIAILRTDAVVEPGAVMVPALDTPVADVAVLGAGCRQNLTTWANIIRAEKLQQVHNV